ncbi:F-box domain-containing protein [Stagonosporopsis vannaccii]|nr:F-box domain-containing protein [Stagonosporopsis vannaccii]
MVGRRASRNDAHHQESRTGVKAKGVTFASNHGALSSDSSVDAVDTRFAASSIDNATTSSSAISQSGYSTAMTSNMTDEDRCPNASSSPTTTTTHAHPSLTLLELVSNSASSSALPDSFDFSISRKGRYVAVYSASNIWLIQTVQLPRLFARTLQVKRKPVAIDITEDGFLLAVLSRPSQVDLYEIHGEQGGHIKMRRTVQLVHEASSLVLSPDARILITGNKFGIEVVAVYPDAPATARRTLSGPAGDALEFSDDGRTLLITGYARKSDSSALFVLPGLYDGPLDEEGAPIPQAPETVWTGSVLFPETARIARQATLLPDADTGTFNELFAFNAEEDSWGIYDIACQRFTQRKMFLPDHQRWTRSEFVDDAMPAVSPNADLAAVALRMRGTTNIWIYEVPGWEYKPSEKAKVQAPIQPCFCIPIPKLGDAAYQEICVLRWVKIGNSTQRLIAVGNSSMAPTESDAPDVPMGSRGVIIVLDFDKTNPQGSAVPVTSKTEYDLDPLCPGEMLPEGSLDFNQEVELMRTRTLAQRRAQDQAAGPRRSSRSSSSVQRSRTTARPPPMADEEELTAEEAQAAFEIPYDNQQPRSQMSLARAATVAAVSPANRRHLRALPFRPLEYRRADGSGQREIPHESDADNWVPPPPAYTAKAEESESVSLSHPNAPPTARRSSRSAGSRSGISPVPALPAMSATVNPSQLSPSGPYQNGGQSLSATDVSLRRPSLRHPTTYPNPHSSDSIQRRGSAAHSPPLQPRFQPAPPPPSTASPSRRPSLFTRRAVETTIDTRPAPTIDPSLVRRGSAPLGSQPLIPSAPQPSALAPGPLQRRLLAPAVDRPLPPNPPLNPTSTPVPRHPTSPPAHLSEHERRSLVPLPRLVAPQQHQHAMPGGALGPMSAPPRTEGYRIAEREMQGRLQGAEADGGRGGGEASAVGALRGQHPQEGGSETDKERQKGGKKKRMACAVM